MCSTSCKGEENESNCRAKNENQIKASFCRINKEPRGTNEILRFQEKQITGL